VSHRECVSLSDRILAFPCDHLTFSHRARCRGARRDHVLFSWARCAPFRGQNAAEEPSAKDDSRRSSLRRDSPFPHESMVRGHDKSRARRDSPAESTGAGHTPEEPASKNRLECGLRAASSAPPEGRTPNSRAHVASFHRPRSGSSASAAAGSVPIGSQPCGALPGRTTENGDAWRSEGATDGCEAWRAAKQASGGRPGPAPTPRSSRRSDPQVGLARTERR